VPADIVPYFAVTTVILGTVYLAGGLLTRPGVKLALITGPIVGLYAGVPMFGLASEIAFCRICFTLMLPPSL
jgi:hypothetical protein